MAEKTYVPSGVPSEVQNRTGLAQGTEKIETIKPEKKSFKDKYVATSDELEAQTKDRADFKNRKEMAIGANPAVNKIDRLLDNATGLRNPVNKITNEDARTGNTPEPVKADGGSVLGDLVDEGKIDDTFKSGAMGGLKDDIPLTTEEKTAEPSENNTVNTAVEDNTANTAKSNTQQSLAENTGLKEWEIAQKVLDENNPYKSGADYLKYLWGKGAGGKAQAIANVLGNTIGSTLGNLGKNSYQTDWERYKNDYTKQSMERKAQAAQDAEDMVKTAGMNEAARNELVKALNQAVKQGAKISPEGMAAIQAFQTATQPSSALNKAIASLVTSVQDQGLFGTVGNILTGLGGKK